jgi:hypothetical protein
MLYTSTHTWEEGLSKLAVVWSTGGGQGFGPAGKPPSRSGCCGLLAVPALPPSLCCLKPVCMEYPAGPLVLFTFVNLGAASYISCLTC